MIIDTHCHLDDNRYFSDLDEVLKRAQSEGVKGFLIPGADPDDLNEAYKIANRYSNVYFATGVHPYECEKYDEKLLSFYLKKSKCIAVGECGLDYYRLPKDSKEKETLKENQKRVFVSQIELAQKFDKPLIVHIRDASKDSLDILLEYKLNSGGVLHCYNADESLLELSKRGFYFGIGGVLTFKNAKKLVNVLPKIPLDKILIETDAPYLTPHPYRGERNEPSYTVYVAQKISEILNITYEEVCKITTDNAKRVFKVDFE